MSYVITSFVGDFALACAGRNLVTALNAQGLSPRLVNRQAQYVDAETTPNAIMAALTSDPGDKDVLIVQGTLADLAAISDGDLPRYPVGVLLNSFEDIPLWRIESLQRYAQIWTPDESMIQRIKNSSPSLDIRLFPLPFPPQLVQDDRPKIKGFYSFSNNVEEVARWCFTQVLRKQDDEKLMLVFAPEALRESVDTSIERVLNSMDLPVLKAVTVTSGDSLPDDTRYNVHLAGLTYIQHAGDNPFWESEAAAFGAKFCTIANGQTVVNGSPKWAYESMKLSGQRAASYFEELRTHKTVGVQSNKSPLSIGYVIPHGNRGSEWVEACLRALLGETVDGDQVVVVDMASPIEMFDEIMRVCSRFGVCLARGEGGWNLGRARNIGAQVLNRATTHLCFLDVDVLVPHGFGRDVRKALAVKPMSTALILRVGNHDEFLTPEKLPMTEWPSRPQYVRPGTGNVVLATDIFLALRGFDESYAGWGSEDVELLYRARKEGLNVRELHEAKAAYHQHHESSADREAERKRNIAKLWADCSEPEREVNANGWGQDYSLVYPAPKASESNAPQV